MVTRTGISGAMRSKETVHEEGMKRDGKMGEERIEYIEGTDSDTEIVTKLRGRDGEIETIIESTKIGEERVDEVVGSWEEVKGKEAGRTGEVVEVLMVEMMVWTVEAGMEEVLRILTVSC